MRYLCQPCDHRWWQHRHPDPRMRLVGVGLMLSGVLSIGVGLAILV